MARDPSKNFCKNADYRKFHEPKRTSDPTFDTRNTAVVEWLDKMNQGSAHTNQTGRLNMAKLKKYMDKATNPIILEQARKEWDN